MPSSKKFSNMSNVHQNRKQTVMRGVPNEVVSVYAAFMNRYQ